MDSVDRKVKEIIGREVVRVHGLPGHLREQPSARWCCCGHPDDDHHGPHGEFHCSVEGCGCLSFDLDLGEAADAA